MSVAHADAPLFSVSKRPPLRPTTRAHTRSVVYDPLFYSCIRAVQADTAGEGYPLSIPPIPWCEQVGTGRRPPGSVVVGGRRHSLWSHGTSRMARDEERPAHRISPAEIVPRFECRRARSDLPRRDSSAGSCEILRGDSTSTAPYCASLDLSLAAWAEGRACKPVCPQRKAAGEGTPKEGTPKEGTPKEGRGHSTQWGVGACGRGAGGVG